MCFKMNLIQYFFYLVEYLMFKVFFLLILKANVEFTRFTRDSDTENYILVKKRILYFIIFFEFDISFYQVIKSKIFKKKKKKIKFMTN